MKQSVTRKLFSYWNDLRGERMAPERDAIDPAAIKHLLLDTFILEVDPARELPVRVAGARVTSLFMRELKGESFTSLYRDRDRECVSALVESVLDDPIPAVAGVSAAPRGREPIDLELLLLPLRHHGKTHARLLGSLTPASYPAWLGLIEIESLRLTSLRIIRPDALERMTREPQVAPAFSVVPLHGGLERDGAGSLRVYEGGRTG